MGLTGLTELYHYYNTDLADPRTSNWWLVSSAVPITLIQLSYLYFVLKCGPRFMENRKPYSLKTFITWYNVFQIITNSWLVYGTLTAGWTTRLTVGCEPVDYSMDPMSHKLAEMVWWVFMLKLIDLVETAVFVLRKKNRQISFLHLYHHISTVSLAWVGVKYFPGGMATFSILVNSMVHIIMYTYYLLAARGPRIRNLISPIKPYITVIQMVQFCVLVVHTSQALLPSCPVPNQPAWGFLANLFINFVLFYNFYQQNYVKTQKTL